MGNIWLRIVKFFVVALLLPVSLAFAAEGIIPEGRPDVVVQTAVLGVMRLIKEDQGEQARKRERVIAYVENVLSPIIDYSRMTKTAMSRNWRLANDEEKIELTQQFRLLLVNAYAGLLMGNTDRPVIFAPPRMSGGGTDASIRVVVASGTPEAITLVIRMEQSSRGWLAYDIEVENISIVLAYQSSFRDEVNKGGIAGLINVLKRKNSGLR